MIETNPQTEVPARHGFGPVLRNRAFLRMWAAQAISQVAQNIISLALLVTVNNVSASTTAVSGVIVASALPGVFFSAFAGVLVDRSDKRTVMALVNVLRAVTTVGFVLASGLPVAVALIGIYVLSFGFASVTQFFNPAEGAAIPFMVRKGDLTQANALFTLTVTVSQLVGFATLGPVLIAVFGLDTLYVALAGAFLSCAGLITTLPRMKPMSHPRVDGRGPISSVWYDMREAWVYIYRDRLLLTAMGFLTFASSAFLAVGVLAPKFASETLQLGTNGLVYILAPAGIGMVIGVVIVGRLARPENREAMIHGGAFSQGIILFLFSIAPAVWYRILGRPTEGALLPLLLTVMAMALLLGIGQAFIVVPSQTLLQERSREEVRARVLSTFFTLSNASALLPTLGAGLIGDAIGVPAGLAALAVVAFVLGLFGVISGRRARVSVSPDAPE